MYKGDKVQVNIEPGTIERKETIIVEYKGAEQPGLGVEVNRPYEVIAKGQTEGVAKYTLQAQGTTTQNAARVSEMGLVDAIKAGYKAFQKAVLQGGITQKDVAEVGKAVDEYNGIVDKYKKVAGKKLTVLDETKEIGIDELSDKELSDLERSVQ